MKSRIYVDLDGVICDYQKSFEADLKKTPEIAYPQSQYGFFTKLDPIEGAIEAMESLWDDPRYDVWILTAPSTKNPLSYSEKRVWVENHLGFHYAERLILAPNKSLLRGDMLIDDTAIGNGQDEFVGVFFHFGSKSFENWKITLPQIHLCFEGL